MDEIWKDIVGYEGYYQVSNLGRVKSLDRYVATVGNKSGKRLSHGKILSQTDGAADKGSGYYMVQLCKYGKSKCCTVHRLVAEAFIPNEDNLPCVNHRDENKHNNNVNNLEWCTFEYNNKYGTARERCASKTRRAVLKFDKNGNIIKKYDGLGIASKTEGVSKGNLANVCVNRNSKRTLNDHVFMYEDDYLKNGFIGYENLKTRKIKQYDLGGNYIETFDSIKQAYESIGNFTNNGAANITAVCRGRQKSAYGYKWEYAD